MNLGGGSYSGNIADTGLLNYTSSTPQTLSGNITGSGGAVTMNASGSTLTLSGANQYTGATTISTGGH